MSLNDQNEPSLSPPSLFTGSVTLQPACTRYVLLGLRPDSLPVVDERCVGVCKCKHAGVTRACVCGWVYVCGCVGVCGCVCVGV